MIKTGLGWDLHRLEEGRPLILGGVHVDSPLGSVAHSDGDALIHAVIDALLGACSLSDIGTYFPDTDEKYRNISSLELLGMTMELVEKSGFRVVNVDSNVVLQSPRLSPYIPQMRAVLSTALGLEEGCVSVKAKTAEHILMELGQGRAVMTQAVVLVETL